MDFTATRVSTEDFAGDQIKSILTDANKQIELEKRMIAQGIYSPIYPSSITIANLFWLLFKQKTNEYTFKANIRFSNNRKHSNKSLKIL